MAIFWINGERAFGTVGYIPQVAHHRAFLRILDIGVWLLPILNTFEKVLDVPFFTRGSRVFLQFFSIRIKKAVTRIIVCQAAFLPIKGYKRYSILFSGDTAAAVPHCSLICKIK